jgi:hydroxymethylglutaryl-CoA lyase
VDSAQRDAYSPDMIGFVRITDVAPRDGLQNESRTIPTADKVELVRLLTLTGVDEVEVSSFVSPKWVPQLADAAEVFEQVAGFKRSGLVYSALVPNQKGMDAALAANRAAGFKLIDKITVFTAATEEFARRNTNATIAETLERFGPVVAAARDHGIAVRAYISCVIRCPYAGPVAPAAVADVSRKLIDIGCQELDLGDTIGAGTPQTVREMLVAVRDAVGRPAFEAGTLHLHDTFGAAASCVPVALELGMTSFDGSAGGLGGCPFASTPGRRAPGNIATETLLRTVRTAGWQTRVDEEKLASASAFARRIVGAGQV